MPRTENRHHNLYNQDTLWEAVESEFYCLETNFIVKLYRSMPDRRVHTEFTYFSYILVSTKNQLYYGAFHPKNDFFLNCLEQ